LSAGISAAVVATSIHAVMGTGGAPEGVLTAAALRLLERPISRDWCHQRHRTTNRLAKMGVKIQNVSMTRKIGAGRK